MSLKSRSLAFLSFLAIVVLASGCTGLDPAALAKSNELIKQFMNEHPNAEIKVTHFTAEQSKNIIDQIRQDCDNPYMDEKEYYRVNVTDPDTNFFATVWIDWSTKTVECVYKVGTEGTVIEKPKPKPECESHSYAKCDSGHMYWFDSCGNKQEKKEYCKYGCSENKCLGECKSQAEYRCYGDYVYWFDSCGNKQEKKEYCQYGCGNGFCKPYNPTDKICEQAGGYCIYPATVSTSSGGGGGAATSTGMIVSAETTTATNTIVSYECKDGYEASPNYFCKEGGICCVPKSTPEPVGFCGWSTGGPCSSDSECTTGGCSGQVCQSVNEQASPTTCEYKECYNAQKYGMTCKCVIKSITPSATAAIIGETSVQGRCQWTKSPTACTADAKICPDGTAVGRNPAKNCEFDPCPTANMYRNAYWQCHDGKESSERGETSCKSYEIWRQYAEEFCVGRCNSQVATDATSINPIKCGVNSFRVWNECSSTGTCTDSTGTHKIGESWKAPDGCNTCSCSQSGIIACTKIACPACTDSDGGKNYYQTGTATASGQSLTDHCNDDGTLTEKYCSEGQISAEVYQCPYGCQEGACVQQACIAEDQSLGAVVADNYNACCTGLTQIGTSVAGANGACEELVGSRGYCTKCGDGICKSPENSCNCPKDCQASCSNECTTYGKSECITSSSYKICGNYDSDACNEWSQIYNCIYGCSNGTCIDQSQICSENQACTIGEGRSATVSTGGAARTIKIVGVSSGTTAAISVDGISKEVTEQGIYYIDGTEISVSSIFYSSSFSERQVSLTIKPPKTCTEGYACTINEGQSAVISTQYGTHTLKLVGVSSDTMAAFSVNSAVQEVGEGRIYQTSGVDTQVYAVYYFGQTESSKITVIVYLVPPSQVCTAGTSCTIKEGQYAKITKGEVEHTIKLIGVSSTTSAALSVNGVVSEVFETNTHPIADLSLYIEGIFYSTSDPVQNQVTLTVS